VKKYGRSRQATGGNIIRRMRFAFWITKATHTYTEYEILLFDGNIGHANALQCNVNAYIACLIRKI